jgi:hypothetical protein
MKQERNIITMDEYGRIHFPSTTNNDIWMNTNELIELFGIKYSILRGNIKAIYKSGILDECEVQRCIKLSNGISIDVYALPMIVALSFRLNTLGAYKVRECVMNKLTTMPRNGILFLNVRTHECMNKSKYGLN